MLRMDDMLCTEAPSHLQMHSHAVEGVFGAKVALMHHALQRREQQPFQAVRCELHNPCELKTTISKIDNLKRNRHLDPAAAIVCHLKLVLTSSIHCSVSN